MELKSRSQSVDEILQNFIAEVKRFSHLTCSIDYEERYKIESFANGIHDESNNAGGYYLTFIEIVCIIIKSYFCNYVDSPTKHGNRNAKMTKRRFTV